jgi:hypothetical protein
MRNKLRMEYCPNCNSPILTGETVSRPSWYVRLDPRPVEARGYGVYSIWAGPTAYPQTAEGKPHLVLHNCSNPCPYFELPAKEETEDLRTTW